MPCDFIWCGEQGRYSQQELPWSFVPTAPLARNMKQSSALPCYWSFSPLSLVGWKKKKTRTKCILCNKKVIKLSNFCHKKRSSWETGSTNLSIMRRASNCSTNSILIIAMKNSAHKVWLPTNTVSCVQFSSYLRNSGHGTTFFSLTYLADEPHLANTTNSVARDSLLNS